MLLAKIKFIALLWLHSDDVASELARFGILEQACIPKVHVGDTA